MREIVLYPLPNLGFTYHFGKEVRKRQTMAIAIAGGNGRSEVNGGSGVNEEIKCEKRRVLLRGLCTLVLWFGFCVA